MKINIKYTLIVAFVVMSILLVVMNLQVFNVTSVTVSGNEKTTSDDITKTALSYVKENSNNIFWINSGKIESAVETLPYVKEANVKKVFPNTLVFQVVERKAVAYLVYNKNSYIYIDKDGYVLEVTDKPLENSPLITGVKYGKFVLNEPLKFEDTYTLQKVMTLKSNMDKYNLQNYQITIDLLEDFNVKLIINNITVGLGEFESIDKKMRYLKSILMELDEKGYVSGYIDLSDFDKPITFKYSAE